MGSKVTLTDLYAYEAGVADGRAEQRAADIAALRDSKRCARYLSDRAAMKIAADYLESLELGPTEEAGG
jgi:hypothetical protein